MVELYGKIALVVASVLLFFGIVNSEFLLWDTARSLRSLAYSPIPFIAGSIAFIIISIMAYRKIHRHTIDDGEPI